MSGLPVSQPRALPAAAAVPAPRRARPAADRPSPVGAPRTVAVVGEDLQREVVRRAVEALGWSVVAFTPAEVDPLDLAGADLVVLAAASGSRPDLAVLTRLLAGGPDRTGGAVPVVVVLGRRDRDLTLAAFDLGADDVIAGRIGQEELAARLHARVRPVAGTAAPALDPVTGALTSGALEAQLALEVERVVRGSRPGTLAYLSFHELPGLTARLGPQVRDRLLAQVVRLVVQDGRQLDLVGHSRGTLLLLMPGTRARGAAVRLERLSQLLHGAVLDADGTPVRLTPIIGYADLEAERGREALQERAWTAMAHQSDQLDLHPTRWTAALERRPAERGPVRALLDRYRTVLQVVAQQVACVGLPLAVYLALDRVGLDVTGPVYVLLVAALGLTAALIWTECLIALRPTEPPQAPDGAPPTATAIVAAYLPNEADTVVETVQAFLAQDYPDLQVILAYNSPKALPVERELRRIAWEDPRFEPLRVEGSVSKAQNVNAALAAVRGEFVGMFDADHHPRAGSFHRAWRWLAAEADVVQGHCVVRNGAQNWLTRTVAVEFETIYAVAHPGRARMHGFGIFGGSNGYWRTDLLQRTRMRGSMLTEDIDSSLRVVRGTGGGSSPTRTWSRPSCARTPRPHCGTSGCAGRRAGPRSRCGT